MNAQLVKLDVAAARLGWSAVKLLSLADEGTLLEPGFIWVWNLANNLQGDRRDLRFWWDEVVARDEGGDVGEGHDLSLDQVIEKILPIRRTTFHAGEVDSMFQIRHRTRLDYGLELNGGLVKGRTLYPRETLAAFLRRRWLGHNKLATQPA